LRKVFVEIYSAARSQLFGVLDKNLH